MKTEEIRIVQQITEILNGTDRYEEFGKSKSSINNYDDFFSDKFLVINLIRVGVTFSLFESISTLTPFTFNQWADFLNISTKSLQRYKQKEKQFKPILSEKIIELAEVTHKGVDVFGSKEKFELWLNIPNFALGGIKPIDLLKDSYGKELVIAELVRIDHGILG